MIAVEAIKKVLNEQINGCKLLLGILQRERNCLIDLNAGCVEELSKEKDTVLLRLKLLEDERVRLVRQFFEKDLTLREISSATGDVSLLDIRSALLSLAQSVEELNQFNRLLIDRSLSYVRSTANFFGYHGINRSNPASGGLLSTEI